MGNGWKVALTTLMNERAGAGLRAAGRASSSLDELIEEAKAARLRRPTRQVRDRLAQLYIEAEVLRLNAYRGLTAIESDGQPGPGGLAGQVAVVGDQPGADRAGRRPARARGASSTTTRWTYRFLRARGNSIEGGTTEILKNIVAERVLGLPRLR